MSLKRTKPGRGRPVMFIVMVTVAVALTQSGQHGEISGFVLRWLESSESQ